MNVSTVEPIPWIGVLGTWGYGDPRRDWRLPGGPFDTMMTAAGFEQLWARRPFTWDTRLDGLPGFLDNNGWEANGDQLAYMLEELAPGQRNGIFHSYAGALIMRAATRVKVGRILTIGTPPHRTIRKWARQALEAGHIEHWTHVLDKDFDKMGLLGALTDLEFRFTWRPPFVDRTMNIPGVPELKLGHIGHSNLLYRPQADVWEREGLFKVLRDDRALVAA